MAADNKTDISFQEVVHDHDLTGGTDLSKQDIASLAQLTEAERVVERRLRRKIDLLIMPLVITVYLLNYIDRNSYAAAKLQGLVEDLHLTDSQYQTGLSVLFVGYVSAPSAMSFHGLIPS